MMLPQNRIDALLETLAARFEKYPQRHPGLEWESIKSKLLADPKKIAVVYEMEESGGEPDVVLLDSLPNQPMWVDCAAESPKGRRSLCYDQEAWLSRKEHKPKSSALEIAQEWGVQLLDEVQYHDLQKLGAFDVKTSSWLKTPESVRQLGGAIFGDFRFGRVFIYHNGAESYYASRGFRGMLAV